MTESKLSYLGPIPKAIGYDAPRLPWWKRVPLAFLLVVCLPTLIAAIYYLLIASPRYESEAQFIVRASNESRPSSLGVALETVGISSTTSEAFAVHKFMESRDGFDLLKQRFDLRRILSGPEADSLSRYPRPWEGPSDEAFYTAFKRFIVVGYDSTTGISTIRIQAFNPDDAQRMTETLLVGGEALVNRLNERAAGNAIADATRSRDLARTRLSDAQQQLTAFRNREQFIDPETSAREGAQLVGGLLSTVAELRAERNQLASEAPGSPQLPILDNRIRAYEAQISSERAKIAGSSGSLAPKLSVYEDLEMNRQFADRELATATASLVAAEQDARRQKLYLERIVSPNRPDAPAEPKRLLAILTVLISCLVLYGIGWFIWAGAHDHRQDV